MKNRYFQLKNNDNIIFNDISPINIKYNIYYKEWLDYNWKKYKKFITDDYSTNFYKKIGKEIHHIELTNIKYSSWLEIESTTNILEVYLMDSFEEISEDEALKVLKENELTFSEIFDKYKLI